jgi:hypothetical protein
MRVEHQHSCAATLPKRTCSVLPKKNVAAAWRLRNKEEEQAFLMFKQRFDDRAS